MFGKTIPHLVSCMCPTRGNPAFVERAIRNFVKQDYPNKELVFVSTNPRARLPVVERNDIHMHFIDASKMPEGRMTIGQQRNVCLELCSGEFVAVWDDDDFYAPERLSFSLGEMHKQRKNAFVLHSETLLAATGQAYVHASRLWENSFVARKMDLQEVRYPNVQIAEDLKMLTAFCHKFGRPALSLRHDLYVYVQQPEGTTSSDPHHVLNDTWQYNISVSEPLEPDEQHAILTRCGAYDE